MQPHVLRLVGFVGLSVAFGTTVWVAEVGGPNPHALLAQVDEAGFIEAAKSPESLKDAAVSDKDRCTVERVENGKKVRYGKLCRPAYEGGNFDAACSPYRRVKPGVCEVIWCTADGAKCFRTTQTAEPSKRDLPTTEGGLQKLKDELGGTKIMGGNDLGLVADLPEGAAIGQAFDDTSFESSFDRAVQIGAESQGLTPEQLARSQGFESYEDYKKYWMADPRIQALQQDFERIESDVTKSVAFVSSEEAKLLGGTSFRQGGPLTEFSGSERFIPGGQTTLPGSLGRQVDNISNAPPGGYSNYNGPAAQNYTPTGLLSSFYGVTGSSYNSGSAGGSIAYVAPIGGTAFLPTGPVPVTSARYDALDSQNTFAAPIQTPYGSISQLSKNSRLTAEERAVLALLERSNRGQPIDTNVLRNSLGDSTANFVENVQDVISGVADFFTSMFVPPEGRELSEEEKAAEEAKKALRFFLEPQDNLLAAGDPEALPTEIPDDEFQPPGQGRGPSSTGFSSGDTADSTSDAIGTIADSRGQTSGGGASAPTETSESAQAPSGSGASAEEESSEPQGVVAKVKKVVGSLVSAVASAIKSGFLRILSWF